MTARTPSSRLGKLRARCPLARSPVVLGAALLRLLVASVGAGTGDEYRSSQDTTAIVRAARDEWARTQRWQVEYEAVPVTQGGSAPPLHRVMAVSNRGEIFHQSAHFSDTCGWNVDPLMQEMIIGGGQVNHHWPIQRRFAKTEARTGMRLPATLDQELILSVIPSWPITNYHVPAGVGMSAERLVRSSMSSIPADLRCLRGTDRVGDEECMVLDWRGLDRLWLAPDKGFCVLRREMRNPQTGRLTQRLTALRLGRFENGPWIPTEIENTVFSSVLGTAQATEVTGRIRVLDFRVDERVSPSIFTSHPRPGSGRYTDEGFFEQVTSGGEDLLDDYVSFITRCAEPDQARGPASVPSSAVLLCGFAWGLILPSIRRTFFAGRRTGAGER